MEKYTTTPAPQHRKFFKKPLLWLSTTLIVFVGLAAGMPMNELKPIVLQAEPLGFAPKEFYIADVIDERENRTAVAWLLPVAPSLEQLGAPRAIDLQGGALKAVQQFTRQSLARNTALRPLVIRLHEIRVSEEAGDEGRVVGRVAVAMSFALKYEDEYLHLVDYEGGVRYSRSPKQHTVVEPALRRSLVAALEYLNTWMDSEAGTNEKLAKGVKVFFSDYTHNAATDTVFYAPDRPLVWSDFKGKPRQGPFGAAVMPTFAYGGPSQVVDGYIHLNLSMRVFALQENCWATPLVKNDWGLNHEQRHFDIVKLIAERFKAKIKAKKLPIVDYSGLIATEYIHSFREMNRMQDQYDQETQHSRNAAAQERWNHQIDAELKLLGVKN